MPAKKPPRRKSINIRYVDESLKRSKRLYKPMADIIGWMEAEGFDRKRLLRESEEVRGYFLAETQDPYFFILEEILNMKNPPPAYEKGHFFKAGERKVTYFSYRTHRRAYELMLWFFIQADFPEQTRDYYRGRLIPTALKKRISIGQTYWVIRNHGKCLVGPLRVLGWDGVVAPYETVGSLMGTWNIRVPMDCFLLDSSPDASDTSE